VINERDFQDTVRVLAVNHNHILREGLRSFLEAQSRVKLTGSVADADSAVRLFEGTRPDLTLVDLNLPSDGGIDVIRRIRHIDREAWIIGLVTYEWDDRGREAVAAGAAAVLSKDLIGEKLVPMIRTGPRLSESIEPVKKTWRRWRAFVRAILLHNSSRA
jgi:two-component system NarL family response regulator